MEGNIFIQHDVPDVDVPSVPQLIFESEQYAHITLGTSSTPEQETMLNIMASAILDVMAHLEEYTIAHTILSLFALNKF